jgi:Fe-S cluster assembly iron-binding protein IscA
LAASEIDFADNLIGASFRINARRPRHRAAAEQASRSNH